MALDQILIRITPAPADKNRENLPDLVQIVGKCDSRFEIENSVRFRGVNPNPTIPVRLFWIIHEFSVEKVKV